MMTRAITGRDVLFGFCAFFALIFAANAALVYFAVGSWTGLETEQSYAKGLTYNRVLEAGEAQKSLGWKGSISLAGGSADMSRLDVTIADRKSDPLEGLSVTAVFTRPTHEGHDLTRELRPAGGGTYTVDVSLPLKGQWNVRVIADGAHSRYVFQDRVYLK